MRRDIQIPSFGEIQERLRELSVSELPTLRISVLRNIMLEPIEPYIRYFASQIGFNGQVQFGEYDNIYQEAVGDNVEAFLVDTDCILIFMKLETVSWDLSRNLASLSPREVICEVERIKDYVQAIVAGIRSKTGAMILWHGFELPIQPAFGICDSQMGSGQRAVVESLNEYLRTRMRETANAFFVDLNLCVSRIGEKAFYDPRYWHIGRAPFTREALCEIAWEDFKFIRALKGKNKKCLVVDCDNVLWGGIVGEDGLDGIELGKTYPGSAYYEFQQEILNLYNRGIILGLCTKNNSEDVWEVFRKHPHMVLKEEHIATAQINWQDKATNLRQIALDLNIGVDSVVFVDDSEFETNLVREALPEVEVIHLPKNRAVEYRDILCSCGLFDTLTLSEEDKKRGATYRSEASRKKLRAEATDMESYYRSLEMVLEVRFADGFAIPRIAQLTQKTNQFNLTTRRYSDADIRRFAESDRADVIYARLQDRFGDSGIVGACILRYEDGKAVFDSFLLSCRVLGRRVEDAFMVQALKLAKNRGCEVAIGEYYATRKNSQVKELYPKHGFRPSDDQVPGVDGFFRYELRSEPGQEPDFFKIVSEVDRGEEAKV
jgi:FkbH-like protein